MYLERHSLDELKLGEIKTRLEGVDIRADEPTELFLFRVSEILRSLLPVEYKRVSPLDLHEMKPGVLLFSRPEVIDLVDNLLQKKMELDKVNQPLKKVFFKEQEIIDVIHLRSVSAPDDMVDLETEESMQETFTKTRSNRYFFNYPGCREGLIDSLFLINNPATETQEKYLRSLLENKDILLVGGGNSCDDLVSGDNLNIKNIVNIDPFLEDESTNKGEKHKYFKYSSQDPDLVQKLGSNFDEIWANYSISIYSRTPEDIKASIKNMVDLLKVGGTIRIFPLAVGYDYSLEKEERMISDSMFEALAKCIEELDSRDGLNVFYVPKTADSGGTLFIKRLK